MTGPTSLNSLSPDLARDDPRAFFSPMKSVEEILEEINYFDEWGFQIRHDKRWPETISDVIERYQWNLLYMEQYIKNGVRLPSDAIAARERELSFLQQQASQFTGDL